MDLSLAIKPEFIRTNKKIINDLYRVARKKYSYTFDSSFLENKALFKSPQVARQETLKEWQSPIRNKVFAKDSSSIFVVWQEGYTPRSSELNFSDGGDASPMIISNGSSCRSFISEYSLRQNHSLQVRIKMTMEKFSRTERLVFAFHCWQSDYTEDFITKTLVEEFKLLEAIASQVTIVRKHHLWDLTEYTRHEIRNAFDMVKSLTKKQMDKSIDSK